MSTQSKVMVLGLDGLTLDRLQPFIAQGKLPTFARLLENGACGRLRSVTNMTTGPTWVSFGTGCLPQKHGVWHDFHHLAGGYTLRPTSGRDYQLPPFWQVASEAGKKVIVLNVPLTYPAQPVAGVLLAGIDAPHERAPHFDYPAGSYQALQGRGIDYLIDCGLASFMQAGDIEGGVAAVERETEGRTQAAEYFMQQIDWDLLVVVYSLPDVWQHYYWTAPPDAFGYRQIEAGYRLLDRHLARLLTYLPEAEGVAVICSDHGFGPLRGSRDAMNNWLAQQGLLRYQTGRVHRPLARFTQLALDQLRKRISFRRRQQILASWPPLRRFVESRLRIGGLDWTQTKVYAALDHLELWINLQGRQRQGCVAPAEYEPLCERVTKALLTWRDEKSDLPYIKTVERQPYPHSDEAVIPPDLALEWTEAVTPPALHPLITGDHAPDGTLIVSGSRIRSQPLAANLIDVAPMALHALGVPVPEGIQGKIPPHLFKESRSLL